MRTLPASGAFLTVITINTERGLQRIESFNEVYEIPGIVGDIDPKSVKLEAIIGNNIHSLSFPSQSGHPAQPFSLVYPFRIGRYVVWPWVNVELWSNVVFG